MGAVKRILLVEDDPKDVELILTALSEQDLAGDVAVVHDGVEALDYLYRRGPFALRLDVNPVVILLDLKLPRLDGKQVLKQLRSDERFSLIPVIILTSSREAGDLESVYRLGANSYVVKPVHFAEFLQAVKEVGSYWTLINEPVPARSVTLSSQRAKGAGEDGKSGTRSSPGR
ncbi:MAG: response regulator [Desulfobacteraceae bacterium]|nr:MAG: response regulator [Desulfobacteraceae bacterium]